MTQRRLLIPSLASLGQEAGFAMSAKADLIRIRTFQGGALVASAEFKPDRIVRIWRSQWAPELAATDDEMNTVELVGEIADIEGEVSFRNDDQQIAVLTGLVPLRDSNFKFSPILHQAHYNVLMPNCETYVVLVNLAGEGERPSRPNKLQVEIRNLTADVLAVTEIEAGLNATCLLPIGDVARRNGVSPEQGLSVRIRGGASQFALFTVFRNLSSGALGIEHSLPPIYFTEAPFNPALRSRFQKAAFGDLKL
ncbi:hypothetical protein JIR23_24595 [Bradyrhizobium diazoefficiens]|nr:hypothetical protein [Bradyrhizobium diazoefficiens]QQN62716.1 hypothetical protein JIR23_24595 [Bradyrhizobium diazoefficiens]